MSERHCKRCFDHQSWGASNVYVVMEGGVRGVLTILLRSMTKFVLRFYYVGGGEKGVENRVIVNT